MAKNLNVNLTFTANTQQAQQQLQQLQVQLNSLSTKTALGQTLTSDISKGISAANQLKTMLQSATDVNTGKLNLSQFNQSLQQSGMKLSQFADRMAALGPEGTQAFQNVARSIANAQVPLRATNTLLDKMWTTMANTMRWQISATVLQGFISTISGAYQYAQDLNESLNNIRIVTGQSVEEMQKFAESANEAAKALSTSTTEYTNAALIYYQQGLGNKEVKERTDATVKLANVTGETAETVSEWMTSIWNNFDNGSKSLEYYADVITALGAATASSSDEIATGLEKFAAVADTVGLSYEYATAALATVTAQTRQSADVVGTAFKTLFARIQDLELGETLDDGTTLGQYSEALYKVGINIKDASGGLKDMDIVLNEMGAKWQQLNKDQQVALAKSVAGIRQYTQLIALMDNWDFFQSNLNVASNSTGELQKQADIYAESWEAANKRVKAAAEDLYDDLLKDDFFIELTNSFASVLNGIGDIIDAMGGLKGLLPLLFVGFSKLFGEKMLVSIRNFSDSMKMSSTSAQQAALATKQNALSLMSQFGDETKHSGTAEIKELELQKKVYDINHMLTQEEERQIQLIFDQLAAWRQVIQELEKKAALSKEGQVDFDQMVSSSGFDGRTVRRQLNGKRETISGEQYYYEKEQQAQGFLQEAADFDTSLGEISTQEELQKKLKGNKFGLKTSDFELDPTTEKYKAKSTALDKEATRQVNELSKAYEKAGGKNLDAFNKGIKQKIGYMADDAKATAGAAKATEEHSKQLAISEKAIKKLSKTPLSNTIMATAQSVSSLAMGFSALSTAVTTIIDGFKEGNISFNDFLSVLMSMSMAIPMIISGFKGMGSVLGVTNAITAVTVGLEKAYNEEKIKGNVLTALGITLKDGETIAETKRRSVQLAGAAAEALMNGHKGKGIMLSLAAKAAHLLEAIGLGALIPVKYADATASTAAAVGTMTMLWPIGLLVLAVGGLVLAIVGLIAIFKGLSDAYNADAIAAEKAKKQAEETANAYNEVKQAYDDLKSSLEDYTKASEAIDKLKEGTKEWKEAVQEANEKVLEMLDTYPELAQYVDNVNGRLVISEQGQNQLLHDQGQRVAALQNINAEAQLQAKQTQLKADRTNALRTELDTWADWGGTTTGTTLGATIGTFILPGIGSAIGAGIGALAGGITDIIGNSATGAQSEEALQKIQDLYLEEGDTIFENFDETLNSLGITSTSLKNTFLEQQDVIEELVKTEKDLLENEKLLNQQKTDNLLYSQDHFITDSYGQGVQKAATEEYNRMRNNALETIGAAEDYSYGKWYTFGIAKGGTDKGKQAFKDYAKLMGYENAKATDFKGDEVKFKYEKDGETKELSVSYENLENALTEAAVADQAYMLANKVNEMTSQVRILKNSADSMDQAIGSFLEHGSLDYLDPEIYNQIAENNFEISQEQATLFGYDSVEAAKNAFQEAYNKYDEAIAKTNLLAQEQVAVNQTLSQGAAELEMSETILRAYAESLTDNSEVLKENKELAAELAVQHYRTGKGIKALKDVLKENIDTLRDADASSLDYYESLGAVKDQLEATFGTKVSANFVKNNLSLIQEMANGSTEALKKLRQSLVDDFIINLAIDEEYKTALQSEMNELMAIAENSPLGMEIEFDNTKAIEGINQALQAGSMTVEEVENMFANANLALPQYNIAHIPNTTTSESDSTVTQDTWWGQKKYTMHTSTTNTTWSDIPYFGDNPPVYEKSNSGEYTKKTGTGEESSFTVTSTGNQSYDEDLLKYEDEDDGDRREKERSNKKELEELDIYHEINEELETIENNLNRISKAKDRAFGAAKLKYLEKEVQLEEKALKAEKEKLKIANDRVLSNQKELNKYGFSTDESGNITNYYEQLKFWTEQKQAGKITEDQLEDITDLLDTYESDLDIADELRESIEDREYRINVELALEEVDTKVQLKVEVEDKALQRIEFQLERIQNRAYSAADAITLLGQSATSSMNKYEAGRQGIVDTILTAGGTEEQAEAFIGGDATAIQGLNLKQEHIDQISNYQDMMIEGAQEANDKWKEMHQELDDLWDEYNEDMDDAIGKLEHITSMMESYQNIIDLVGQEALGISDEVMAQFGQTMVETSQAQVEAAKQSLEMNRGFLAEYEAALADAQTRGDQDAIQLWTEKVKYAMQEVQADEEALMSATIASLETIAAERERLIDKAIEDFNQSMFGFDSMDEMQQAYEDQKKISELYLADYKKVYELSKLTRQVNESIDDTNSVKGKQALAKIQEKINQYQKDGVKMSEYELANLQREYELELARIQLEEAQNAKSQVRLQRDSMGNWGYLYTADEEALNEAQQNYEDKVYNIIDANQKYVDETQQLIMEATADFEERMREINLATFANEEERAAAIKKAQDDYQAQMQFYTGQLDIVLDNNDQLYTDSAEHVAGKFGTMQLSADDLTTHYSGTWLGNLTGVFGSSGTAAGVYQELVDKLGTADTEGTLLGDMASAQDAYNDWIKDTFVAGGLVPNLNGDSGSASSTFSDFAENVKDYLGRDEKSGAREAIKNVKDDIGKLVNKAKNTTDGFPAATKAVGDFERDSKPKLNNMYKELAGQNGNGGLNKALEDLYGWWSDIANAPNIDKEINIEVNYKDTNGNTISPDDVVEMFGEDNPPPQRPNAKFVQGNYVDAYNKNAHFRLTQAKVNNSRYNETSKSWEYQLSGSGEKWVTESWLTASTKPEPKMVKANHTAAWSGEQFSSKTLFDQHYTTKKTIDGVQYIKSNESDWWYKVSEAQVTKYYTEHNTKIPYILYGIQKDQQAYQLVSYDTGGYTGEWGPEGRLAMLHQKEIILNAHDTENFLTAVQIVRSMADKLETNALMASQGLGGVVAAITAAATNQTLDQNVTIHAEFPNATNHAEIEEAFRNLTNLASQYANRR